MTMFASLIATSVESYMNSFNICHSRNWMLNCLSTKEINNRVFHLARFVETESFSVKVMNKTIVNVSKHWC